MRLAKKEKKDSPFPNRDERVPLLTQSFQNILRRIVDSRFDILMHVDDMVIGSINAGNSLGEVGDQKVVLVGVVIDKVFGEHVFLDVVVAEGLDVGSTARLDLAGLIWWPHVSWEEAEDVAQGHFELDELGFSVGGGEVFEVGVTPGVLCDLMAGVVCVLEELGPRRAFVVDGLFSHVVAGDEKGCFGVVFG